MKQPQSLTSIGKAMRQLYERYGAEAVLTNEKYLINGLGDLARIDYTPKLRSQMALAMDAGLGRLYLEQLERGKPDDSFNQRVYNLLTLDAGLSDSSAREISGYFNEMMGWNEDPGGPVPGNETTYQKILYYDEQGWPTDEEHAYKTVTQILDKNGNVINEIISYADEDDNAEIKEDWKKTSIIVTTAIVAAVLIVAFIILRPIFNNTAVPQQMNNTTVKYLEDVGNYIFNPQLKKLNEDLTLFTSIPEKEGYTFVEWNTKPDGTGTSYSPGDTYTLNQPLVLYAQWEENVPETVTEPATRSSVSYMITYDANGGTGAPENQRVISGTEFEISNQKPTRNGYEFSGWSTSKGLDDDTGLTYSVGNKYRINNDLKLYAQWKKIETETTSEPETTTSVTYTVTYDANGGTGAPEKQTVNEGSGFVISSQEPTRDGYVFLGWSTSKTRYNDTGFTYITGKTYRVNRNLKLYAQWQKAEDDNWTYELGNWYYYKNGEKITGFRTISGSNYYFDQTGVMLTGWQMIKNNWFFFNNKGKMQTGWIEDNGQWYFLNSSGVMETGWIEDEGQWYYLDSSGKMQTGWLQDNGKWYFLNNSGRMVTGYYVIDGEEHYFAENGAAAW